MGCSRCSLAVEGDDQLPLLCPLRSACVCLCEIHICSWLAGRRSFPQGLGSSSSARTFSVMQLLKNKQKERHNWRRNMCKSCIQDQRKTHPYFGYSQTSVVLTQIISVSAILISIQTTKGLEIDGKCHLQDYGKCLLWRDKVDQDCSEWPWIMRLSSDRLLLCFVQSQ